MKKLFLAVGLLCLSHAAFAGALPRSPKQTFVTSYVTTGSSVAISSLAGSSSTVLIPGAIYQVNLTSGAASEYIVMYDTNTCTGLSATFSGQPTLPAKQLGARLFYGSTTANTNFAFDPPMLFENGVCVFDSSGAGQAAITYEIGRGINGQ